MKRAGFGVLNVLGCGAIGAVALGLGVSVGDWRERTAVGAAIGLFLGFVLWIAFSIFGGDDQR